MKQVIGENIAAKRKERGWTQAHLAELVGVKQLHISRWETGKHLPTIDQFIAIADALQCSLDELAGIKCNNV